MSLNLTRRVACRFLHPSFYRQLSFLLLCTALCFCSGFNSLYGQSFNIPTPPGSGNFGFTVDVLPNGNYVVTDPFYDEGAVANVGAVYLYNGSTHTLISTLKGSTTNDLVGGNGILILANGNFLVRSYNWNNGAAASAGALTWVHAVTGLNAVVGAANSLVGSTANDLVGNSGVFTLTNGNLVVASSSWDNGAIANAGAVTFINAATGITGVVSSSNSLVGSHANDNIGTAAVVRLTNGNYTVRATTWDNGSLTDAGAVTWGSGTTGVSGVVSSSNSLVGSTANDNVGNSVTALTNGNYVVGTPNWDNGAVVDAGAATWGNGSSGITGTISSANSLVGTTSGNNVGTLNSALTNGNYVVNSPGWDNGASTNVGAVTWGNGSTGITGTVSTANSFTGAASNDRVGFGGIAVLPNGNYVIRSSSCRNGLLLNAGAVTLGNGSTGITGTVSTANSLMGSSANDAISNFGLEILPNSNYVLRSPQWDNGAATDAGAVTWCSGTVASTGVVNSSNSLVGTQANDQAGAGGVTVLSNNNYVVKSLSWDNGAVTDAGAATWGSGTSGVTGAISSANSLVGSQASDLVGTGVLALNNGNYVVFSSLWNNGAVTTAGAATWGNGSTGITGPVTSANSLVGSTTADNVGNGSALVLTNGNYVVLSRNWDNGAVTDAGAATWCNGTTGRTGPVTAANSLTGNVAFDQVGDGSAIALSNGNYVVRSLLADNGAATDAGAVTWANGATGITGGVSISNSLMGSIAADQLGSSNVLEQANGNYTVSSFTFDNGPVTNSGAISFGMGSAGLTGTVTVCNSVAGNAANLGFSMGVVYNPVYDYYLVRRYNENIVTVFNPDALTLATHLDSVAVNLAGTTPVNLLANSGCRLLATLTPNGGASAIKDSVFSKVWIEPSVPVFAVLPFVARHYEITPGNNIATATGRLTLYCTQQEFDDFNAHPGSFWNLPANAGDAVGKGHLRVACYSGTSNDRSGLPGSYPAGAVVIDPNDADIVWNSSLSRWEISFDATGFGGFIIQSALYPLPVSLQLNAVLSNQDAVLNWKTGEESGVERYILERSTDGRNYLPVYQVRAFNSSGDHQYRYTDRNAALLQAPALYYRVRQENVTGSYGYSAVMVLSAAGKDMVLLYPNPVAYNGTLLVSVQQAQELRYRILDNTGRVLLEKAAYLQAGSNHINLETANLPAGVYQLCISGAMLTERRIFVKR